jgi:pyruvate,water dikinase
VGDLDRAAETSRHLPVGSVQDDWCTDTPLNSRFPVYTRFNANDVVPDPITPLGADLVWKPQVLPGLGFGYVELGALSAAEAALDRSASPAGAFRYGHLYINVTAARLNGIRAGLGWEVIDAAFFGSHPDAPPHEPHPDDADPTIGARIAERTQWTLTTATFPELDEDTRLADRLRDGRPDLTQLSNAALVSYARSVMPMVRLMCRGEVVGSASAAIGPGTIASVLPADLGVSPFDLVGPVGDVVSAEPATHLWNLSRLVRSDELLTTAFDGGLDGLLDRLERDHSAFAEAFAGFIRAYGYRGPAEWDIGADTWETRPELALALIDRLRQQDDDQSPVVRRAQALSDAEQALQRVTELLSDDETALATLRMGLASARRFAGWRERGKSNCVKVINEARVALRELGRRLAADGHLDDASQVFMALDEDLDVLILDPDLVLPDIRQREADWACYADLEIPLFLDARRPRVPVADLPTRSRREGRAASSGDVLTGIPASAGTASGRATVITDIGDIARFQPGDVLVAPQTDPSWTPLFLVASAVVVDVGAPSSHAMIVSRELGIPCVAAVADATVRIADGALVTVDGSSGTVTID